MKGLKALKENKTLINTFTSGNALIKYGNNEEIIEKELKALEIIKDSKIEGLTLVWNENQEMWFVYAPHYEFPIAYGYKKEEYDLIKEVL